MKKIYLAFGALIACVMICLFTTNVYAEDNDNTPEIVESNEEEFEPVVFYKNYGNYNYFITLESKEHALIKITDLNTEEIKLEAVANYDFENDTIKFDLNGNTILELNLLDNDAVELIDYLLVKVTGNDESSLSYVWRTYVAPYLIVGLFISAVLIALTLFLYRRVKHIKDEVVDNNKLTKKNVEDLVDALKEYKESIVELGTNTEILKKVPTQVAIINDILKQYICNDPEAVASGFARKAVKELSDNGNNTKTASNE